ncbi:hypothetical protein GIB67_027746 [Kingdonia uniflora]|uniref:SWIM-type domain-containing protein n=1 Tax=Kingdonia uniflora TaxID=39325 RepID=A0A7J7PC01_9MAGN|nr:hypothetical protein GIB67_027746 [Kingdonia uniflora]
MSEGFVDLVTVLLGLKPLGRLQCSLRVFEWYWKAASFDSSWAADPEEAVAISVIRRIKAALRIGLKRFLVLMDCHRLVQSFEAKSVDPSWGAPTLVPDMLSLASRFLEFRFEYIDRLCNFEAHALAAKDVVREIPGAEAGEYILLDEDDNNYIISPREIKKKNTTPVKATSVKAIPVKTNAKRKGKTVVMSPSKTNKAANKPAKRQNKKEKTVVLSEKEEEDLDDLLEVYHSDKEIDPEEIYAYEDGYYSTHTSDDEDYVPTAEDLERCNEFENVDAGLDDIYSKKEDDKAKTPLTVGFKELEEGMQWVTIYEAREHMRRQDDTLQWTGTLVAFKASLNGFVKGCRPILGLDGYFLKGKYGGVCLSVLSLDSNNGLFQIGVYMCRTECKESWLDFLAKIEPYLSAHQGKLTFISDRQKGLINSVAEIFPHANHRQNEKQEFLNQLGIDIPGAKDYLEKEPYEHWCRSHFDCTTKCEHITNNFIMLERKTKAESWDQGGLVLRAVKHLEYLMTHYGEYDMEGGDKNEWVLIFSTGERWVLNLEERTCQCIEWQLTRMPCIHAASVLIPRRQSLKSFFSPYHFVASYVATYSGIIHPVSDDTHWASPPYVVDPPPLQRGRGRPRKERRKGDNEVNKEQKNMGNVVLLATIKKLANVNLPKFKVHLHLRQGEDHHKSQPDYTSISHSNQMLLKYKQHP